MKTIPLEEALKLATKGPLVPLCLPIGYPAIVTECERWVAKTDCSLGSGGVWVSNESTASANAALLAHFYNHGPELVQALARLVNEAAEANRLQHAGLEVSPEVWSDLYQSEQAARSLLSKASTVQMP